MDEVEGGRGGTEGGVEGGIGEGEEESFKRSDKLAKRDTWLFLFGPCSCWY